MRTVCQSNMCAGCMACVEICPRNAIVIQDTKDSYNAIKTERCIECGACERVCQVNRPPEASTPVSWVQGWANDCDIRTDSSSGGFAAAIAAAFIEQGGVVCSCAFEDGVFKFNVVDNKEELKKFQGSKYVKSNPAGIYKKTLQLLKNGEKVLFIGLPCQSAAIQNYVPSKLHDSLFTVDLICHGTPSPKILEQFLKEKGYTLSQMRDIRFRVSKQFGISEAYQMIVPKGVTDRYTIGFLNGLFYTENCYHCRYAKLERVSDLTLGDSWGSLLSDEERKRGISLALCQTVKGKQLLEWANLHLEEVDLKRAVEANHQLSEPSKVPENRNEFFKDLEAGKSFHQLVTKCYPNRCYRQDVKQFIVQIPVIGKLAQKKWVSDYRIAFIVAFDRNTESSVFRSPRS